MVEVMGQTYFFLNSTEQHTLVTHLAVLRHPCIFLIKSKTMYFFNKIKKNLRGASHLQLHEHAEKTDHLLPWLPPLTTHQEPETGAHSMPTQTWGLPTSSVMAG